MASTPSSGPSTGFGAGPGAGGGAGASAGASASAGTLEGTLSKWTNVMKGWQYRFFVLDENAGLLSYYTVSVCAKDSASSVCHQEYE
ncbi:oxysterol-binding protein-related protein 10-like [Drosophila madeirensis]|uniref:Oxysterol-binding protein-related protein 10-like n=1 Tax=Drosophila madeirensis TaxID=30013 RepID=A0AAU9G9A9_DROMD